MFKFFERFKKLSLLLTALIAFASTNLTFAASSQIPQDVLNMYSQNNILFYDPYACVDPGATLSGNNVTWIGDSYSVGAESFIENKLSGISFGGSVNDAESYIQVSKFVESGSNSNPSGITILEKIIDEKKLKPYLVFALGGNGGITTDQVERVVDLAGDRTNIVFVNLYMTTSNQNTQSYIKTSNEVLKSAVDKYDNVTVADWVSVAKAEYYANDPEGIHPSDGYKEWTDVIYNALSDFSGGISVGAISNNENYAGDQVWSDEQMSAIRANYSVYKKAQDEYGIPWQAIATMHSLETNLSRANPTNGQGLYQLYVYTAGGSNENAFLPAGPVSEEEFERQTLIAAKEMKNMIESQGLSVDSDDGIKALLFQYNGKASQYIEKALALGFSRKEAELGEGSPYVMNRYDARRDPNNSQMDANWPGRFVADGVYDPSSTMYDFGGFVKYIALKGESSNYCGMVSGGNLDLNQTAVDLAWPESERTNSGSTATEAYMQAIRETWTSGYELQVANAGSFDRGDGTIIPVGMSCDNFVGTVVRFSGIDPDFPVWLGSQKEYLATSDKWEQVDVTDSSQAQGGDIRIEYNGGHIAMVVEINGELKIASASSGDRYGDIGSYYQNGITYRLKR